MIRRPPRRFGHHSFKAKAYKIQAFPHSLDPKAPKGREVLSDYYRFSDPAADDFAAS
jgi:hypothetical protein